MRTVPFFKSFSVFKGGITSMFIPIDYEHWNRKEIYDAFHGYLYCMTVELDITEFLKKIHENHWKFYPHVLLHRQNRKWTSGLSLCQNQRPGRLLRSGQPALHSASHKIPTISSPISGLIIARILLHSIKQFSGR